MKDMAVQGSLHNFRPYQDGGGSVTVLLDELQWREFMAWGASLHVPVAVARLNDEEPGEPA